MNSPLIVRLLLAACIAFSAAAVEPWRSLPLITDGKIDPAWAQIGWGGLQNHDPGDVVWFKEISVRPVP